MGERTKKIRRKTLELALAIGELLDLTAPAGLSQSLGEAEGHAKLVLIQGGKKDDEGSEE